ncbi:hypothetical protein [Cupriavidus nantongensis]|nr:hypothetical protein [Cupriavidus nantongensis]
MNTHYRGISVPIALASRMTDANIRRYLDAMQEHASKIAEDVGEAA